MTRSGDKGQDSSDPLPDAELNPVSCPACGQNNHAEQKFCGMCGSPLRDLVVKNERRQAFVETPAPHASAPPEAPPAVDDLQWLRDSALTRLNDSQAPEGGLWKYVLVGLGLILAGFGYLDWVSRTPPVVVRREAPPASASVSQPQPRVPEQPEPSAQAPQPTPPEPAREPPVVEATGPTPENGNQPPVKARLSSPTPTADSPADTEELLIAQRYLEGSLGSRNTTEAAKWLWKAVGKQNTTATLLLADLYARGDGVPKSCNQARLLLVAATRKGSPEAAEKLRRLERNGCP